MNSPPWRGGGEADGVVFMKKQTWKWFCIVSVILFIASIYITIFTFAFETGIGLYMASIALFVIPTLICLDRKSRTKYKITYLIPVAFLALSYRELTEAGFISIVPQEIWFLLWITSILVFPLISIILFTDINKGEKN